MSLHVRYSWSVDVVPTDLDEWVVYASSDRATKGTEVARVNGGERSATWISDENLIWVRVLGRKRTGAEEPWDDVTPDEVLIQGRDAAQTPSTPTNVAVGHVEPSLTGRVAVDPPSKGDPASFVQVIQGADAETGKLLAEHKVLPAGVIGADGPPQQVSASFPMEGYGGTKSIVVRHMSTTGKPSSDVARTVQEPDEMPGHHEVAVCSWSGTTLVNVPAAGTTDAHEFDATDGARARAKPTLAGATAAAGWGTLSSGLLASSPIHGAYLRTITVESDEVDLGGTQTFRLSASDTVGRKTAAGTPRPLWATKVPMIPAAHQDVRLLPEGPAWASRETRLNGKPRQPVRLWRWEYVVGTSTPVAHASSDYKPLVAGQLVRGRYVRVRLVVSDPTGQHRIVCPSATVKALVFRRSKTGAGTPEGSITAPPGSHYFRTDGPPHHYVKSTGVGNTGWLASNAGATVTPPTGTGFPHITAGVQDAAAKLVESADVHANLKDPAAATAGLRTLGTGPATACSGNDARLSDSRTPTAHKTSHENGGGDEISVAGLSGELADPQPPKISGLTSETSSDPDADEVAVYDVSAGANRKMLLRNIGVAVLKRSTTHYDVGPSSVAETTIFTHAVVANTMGTDRMLRLAIRGTILNNSGTTRAIRMRVKFGGTTYFSGTVPMVSSATLGVFHAWVEVQNDGATNVQHISGGMEIPTASAPTTGTASATGGGYRIFEAAGAEDTTAIKTLEVTMELPASDANLYADIERGTLELV